MAEYELEPQLVAYHWVLTLTRPGFAMYTQYGVCTVGPRSTRHGVFEDIRNEMVRKRPEFAQAVTLFFSLEPNDLVAGGR
ncbi:hypothetical protein [Streptomyces sp. NRRL S-1868]|nr:hypothetical protein [Streptomyces sp. NRRL S-1868]